jgi:hypothetical protein
MELAPEAFGHYEVLQTGWEAQLTMLGFGSADDRALLSGTSDPGCRVGGLVHALLRK